MIDYRGHRCVSCHKEFAEGDDVVVCPECGAPYHRDCYAAEGRCVFSARHGAGFEYELPESARVHEKGKVFVCPACRNENPPGALFCEQCGRPLRPGTAPPMQEAMPRYAQPQPGLSGADANDETQYVQPNVMTQLHLAKEYDGVDTKDWMRYIGNSAPYYLYQFQRMNESGRKVSVCWSALLFPEFYFFYRKMWGWGALALAVTLIVSVPPLLSVMAALGLPLALSTHTLEILASLCGVLNWGVRIAAGLFSFYLFRQNAGKRLRAMREESADDSVYQEEIARHAGPSHVAVIVGGLLLIAFSTAFYMWIGPERLLSAFYMA